MLRCACVDILLKHFELRVGSEDKGGSPAPVPVPPKSQAELGACRLEPGLPTNERKPKSKVSPSCILCPSMPGSSCGKRRSKADLARSASCAKAFAERLAEMPPFSAWKMPGACLRAHAIRANLSRIGYINHSHSGLPLGIFGVEPSPLVHLEPAQANGQAILLIEAAGPLHIVQHLTKP